MPIRVLNIVLGVWLFISAFVWPHVPAELTDTWICGVLAVIIAAVALRQEQMRFLNTALAVWLFFSTLSFPHQYAGTSWNNCIVAIVMFLISLVPGQLPVAGGPKTPAHV